MTKRLLLGLILLVTATVASAEWTVAERDDELILYVDKATIRRNGNLVRMWDMTDYKTLQKSAAGNPFLSVKTQREYDCKEEKMRLLAFTQFNRQMGQGNVVYSNGNYKDEFEPIEPRSFGEALWKVACNASNIKKMNIKKAVEKIRSVQKESGMVGAASEVDSCYRELEKLKAPSSSKYTKFEYCASMDLTAFRTDSVVSKKLNFPQHEYFEDANVVQRFQNKIREGIIDKDRLSEIRKLVDEYIMIYGQ